MKIKIEEFRKLDIYKNALQPSAVYHMTTRDNLEPIVSSGKIKTGRDFVCWFFTDIEKIPAYIDLTGAMHGRQYYDFDGKIHTAPPLIPTEQIIIKMQPRRPEPLAWYKENTAEKATSDEQRKILLLFDDCRIAHFDDFAFKSDYEVFELTDILEQYPLRGSAKAYL